MVGTSRQGFHAVLRDAAAPADVHVRQVGASVTQGLERVIRDHLTAVQVEFLELGAVAREGIARRVGNLQSHRQVTSDKFKLTLITFLQPFKLRSSMF